MQNYVNKSAHHFTSFKYFSSHRETCPQHVFCHFWPKLVCGNVTKSDMAKNEEMRQTIDEIGWNQTLVNTIIYIGEGGRLSRSRWHWCLSYRVYQWGGWVGGGGEGVHFSLSPSVNDRISGNINEMHYLIHAFFCIPFNSKEKENKGRTCYSRWLAPLPLFRPWPTTWEPLI